MSGAEANARVLRYAITGAAVACLYAGFECAVITLWPTAWPLGAIHPVLSTPANFLLLTAHLIVGAIIGAGAAVITGRWGTSRSGAQPVRLLIAASAVVLATFELLHRPASLDVPPAASHRVPRPDIVLVSLDTVRSDHLSAYGYARDTSPHLAAFARGATRYENAFASSDLTLSTHASIFTGLYARQHGARVDSKQGALALPERFDTLAEILARAGYATVGVVGNPSYLGSRWGMAQGFHLYDDRRPAAGFPTSTSHALARPLARLCDALLGSGSTPPEGYRLAAEINDEVFDVLAALGSRRPLLLFVNYMDAHWPYIPPPPFDAKYPGRLDDPDAVPNLARIRAVRTLQRPLEPFERQHLTSQYDGEIAYVDEQLGRLFARLRADDRFDESLIIVTADHGEALGERQNLLHGVSVYQDQVHVPLIIKMPGQTTGRVVDAPVSSVDILPSVLEAVGLEIPDGVAGVSLAAGSPAGDRPVVSESYPSPMLYGLHRRYRRTARALFVGRLKLISNSSGSAELYDLAADPREQVDLLGDDARSRELQSAYADWLAAGRAGSGVRRQVDAETRNRLRALGYAP